MYQIDDSIVSIVGSKKKQKKSNLPNASRGLWRSCGLKPGTIAPMINHLLVPKIKQCSIDICTTCDKTKTNVSETCP